MVWMNAAKQKRPELLLPAKIKKFHGVWQRLDLFLLILEAGLVPFLELFQRHSRRHALVKFIKGQAELGAEFLARHRRSTGLLERVIGRAPNRRQVINQRARPIENDGANHDEEGSSFFAGS